MSESTAAEPIHFYFDFLSPYAYFAWRWLPKTAKDSGRDLRCHPVVFGKLLDHWGHLGPAEIKPKREWLARYCLRYAALNGFEYMPPKYHPFNPLPALRLALAEVSGTQQQAVISAIFEAGWSRGADLGELDKLLHILRGEGVNVEGFDVAVTEDSVKQALIAETSAAIQQGVFGVPTIIIGQEFFWGNDQREHIELLLEGKDPLSKEKLGAMAERPRMIDRKRFRERQ